MYKIILASLCFGVFANASERVRFSLGVDMFEVAPESNALNRKDSMFEKPFNSINKLSFGVTFKPFESSHLRFTYKTNALINFAETYETQGGYNLTLQTKAQSYIISHPITRKIAPYIVATDITSISSIDGGKEVVKNGFIYGFGATYLFLPKHGVSLTYFLPSEKLGMKYAYGVSYYYFI